MSPFQKMQEAQENFTKNDRKIYQTILNDPGGVAFASTSELAEICGVSQPAVTRFVKSLGYERYQVFRAELVSFLARNSNDDIRSGGHRYFSDLHTLLNETEDMLSPEYMEELVDFILSFDRIFVGGNGKSAEPARLFSIYVRKLGLVAIVADSAEAKDYGEIMSDRDLLIFFTVNGQPTMFHSIMEGCGTLLIVTAAYKGKKKRPQDRIIRLPYLTTNAEESPVSPILFSVFVELLVSYMSQRLPALSITSHHHSSAPLVSSS